VDVEGYSALNTCESVPLGTSVSESFDLEKFIDIDPLTWPAHEPQNFPTPEISSSADEAIAENSQSHIHKNFTTPTISPASMNHFSEVSAPGTALRLATDRYPSISTPASSEPRSRISTSPSSSGLGSDEAATGKREISSVYMVHSCPTCKVSFTKEAHYRQHRRHRQCTAPSSTNQCDVCQRVFTLPKDLRRHQKRSCTVQTVRESFACSICERSYQRKDSLQRHVREAHAKKSG